MSIFLGNLIIIGTFILVLAIILLYDLKNLKWVHTNLKKPYKLFMKSTYSRKYTLNESYILQCHYNKYDLNTLETLEAELQLIRAKFSTNVYFPNYMTALVAILSLITSVFALTSSILTTEFIVNMVFFMVVLVVIFIACFFGDYLRRGYSNEAIEKHFVIIQRVINDKKLEINQVIHEEKRFNRIKENAIKIRREVKLEQIKNKKKTHCI